MFNNVALDVFIGLVFIFLLYSLLATIIQELIAQFLNLRARMLVKTIRVLLDDRKETDSNVFVRWLNHIGDNLYHFFCPLDKNKLSKAFYTRPAIKYLAQSSFKSKPAYISSNNFSTTIIKLLRGKDFDGTEPQMNAIYRTLFEQNQVISGESFNQVIARIDPETLFHLKQLYIDAQKDIARFQALLEEWFNETMERATGWYKKQTQWISLVIGFVLAVSFNIDTIAISTLLAKDETARENLVQLAINSAPKYDTLTTKLQGRNTTDTLPYIKTDSTGKTDTAGIIIKDSVFLKLSNEELNNAYKIVQEDIDKANNIAGLGWPDEDSCKICDSIKLKLSCCENDSATTARLTKQLQYYNSKFYCNGNPYQKGGVVTFFGWLITALAISLGAPFWFDLLNKFIQLRSSVAKPKEADTGGGSSKIEDNSSSSNIKRVG